MQPSRQLPVKTTIRVPKGSLIVPEGANWFHFAQSNLDVQMMIGYIDPQEAGEYVTAIRAGKKPTQELAPMVTRRIALSMSGFLLLRQQVEQMFRHMREAGIVDDDGTPHETTNG